VAKRDNESDGDGVCPGYEVTHMQMSWYFSFLPLWLIGLRCDSTWKKPISEPIVLGAICFTLPLLGRLDDSNL